MQGINKVTLIGRLGKDPEVRHAAISAKGDMIVNVTMATSESWKDKASGEKQERTEWHRLVFFGKLAEIAAKYLKKGAQTYIEGRLQTRKWQDKDGKDRYTTEIVVSEMKMLDARPGPESGATAGKSARDETAQSESAEDSSMPDDFDGDIPF